MIPHDYGWPRRDVPMTDVLVSLREMDEDDSGWHQRRGLQRGPLRSLVFRDPQYTPHQPKRAMPRRAQDPPTPKGPSVTRRILAAAAVAALAVSSLVSGAQSAAAAGPIDTYVPKTGTIFNKVEAAGGTTAEQYRLSRFLVRTLDSMNSGAVARMAFYDMNSLEDQDPKYDVPDAMIRAHKRGVQVRWIGDGHSFSADELRVRKALGQDVKANKSFAIACDQSCNSAEESAMHLKVATFSSVGSPAKARQIVLMGSSNVTATNQYLNHNQSQVTVGMEPIYTVAAQFFDQARNDPDNERAYKTAASADGKYRAYFWPDGSGVNDPVLAALRSIKSADCKTAGGGYGNGGRTVISVAQFLWTGGRNTITDEVVRLHKAGCEVRVLYVNNPAAGTMAQSVIDRLWNARVSTYNTRVNGTYLHSKLFMVNGKVYGRNNKVVWNGSANWTFRALEKGNENLLRSDDNATYDAFKANFNFMQSLAAKDTKRPIVTPPPTDSRLRQAQVPLEGDFRDLGLL